MPTPDILIKPVVTEKATSFGKDGKYLFFVRKDATKIAVKQTFEDLYGVRVKKVNVLRTAPKYRMGKNRMLAQKKAEYKKVVITISGKKTIDIFKPKAKR